MTNRERAILYSIVAILALLSVNSLFTSTSTPLHAAVAAVADGLGPAPSLALTNAGGPDLILQSRESRLAWSEDPFSRAYSMAFVHIGKPIAQLMSSESFRQEQEQLSAELQSEFEAKSGPLNELTERAKALDPNSPEFKEVFEQGKQLNDELMKWRAEAEARGQKLSAEQLERAYREVVNAVEVVAARKNIDVVYRFVPTNEPFESPTAEAALLAIRLRTVLRYPEAIDITPEVMQEMSMSEE